MVSLAQIYDALDAQKAGVYVYGIGFAPAATLEVNGKFAVFFDPARVQTTAALKACLAHECGHCATGATHVTASPWDIIAKHEYKANRWAIEAFLPYDALCRAMAGGCREAWQLAEYFDLPQEFIERALNHYTGARALPLPACAP